MSTTRPTRVAVMGGGCASLTAAFELTAPEHQGRYEVTVYQMGWRLGGKGASGRGPSGRIEEHGLHLWLGFYENAFALMRACYAELGRDPWTCPIATWQDAFKPAPVVSVVDRLPNGQWEPWIAHFPPAHGLPGDAPSDRSSLTVSGYVRLAVDLLAELLRSAHERAAEGVATPPRPDTRTPEGVVAAAEALLRLGQLATTAALFEAIDLLRAVTDSLFPMAYRDGGVTLRLIDAVAAAARRQLTAVVQGDVALARIWQVIDLIIAILRGCTLSGLALDPRGFDALNDFEWRDWLRTHGASEASLDSGFVRGIYDLVFAYEGGRADRPRLAAGVALRGAMRMFFTYRGSLFWRMSAGMGDIVFAPLYEVLARRGVRFEFFHRLREVSLAPEREGETPYVDVIHFDVQARTHDGSPYRPLVNIKGLPCWPAAPDYEQLADGARMAEEGWRFESPWETRVAGTRTLRVGEDFDLVVLGVPVATLPRTCRELIAREPKWRTMVDNARTVATQAFQVWTTEDMTALGWHHPPVNLSGFVEPFDTWADMTHLVPAETWRTRVRAIAYFCSPMPDDGPARGHADEDRARDTVRRRAVRYLQEDIGALWPDAMRDGRFRWEVLASDDAAAPEGEARFATQFWTGNVNPSERYSLSPPGLVRYRLSPLDPSFDNLTIAGDWTQSGLDSGCVESAVMSGRLAAHALSGLPRLEDIVGYDHP